MMNFSSLCTSLNRCRIDLIKWSKKNVSNPNGEIDMILKAVQDMQNRLVFKYDGNEEDLLLRDFE